MFLTMNDWMRAILLAGCIGVLTMQLNYSLLVVKPQSQLDYVSLSHMSDKKASAEGGSPKTSTAAVPVLRSRAGSQKQLDWSHVEHMMRPKEPFKRYDNVVIATKILGPFYLSELKQMFCLFTAAYNRHVNYDIVVFTTRPWGPHHIQELQAVVPNAKLTVELEGLPLHEQVAQLTPVERERLFQRCKVTDGNPLSWWHICSEEPNPDKSRQHLVVRLSYAWQAEFRAYHIWRMPILAPYKYMMWIDSDSLATKPWVRDPMQVFIENDLVLMFDQRLGDLIDNPELLNKMQKAYNRTICKITLEDGHLKPWPCVNDHYLVATVQGFFHITNLDFYRSERTSRFLATLVETQKFSREWDDQIAVTIPAVMDAPERAWDMRSHGLHMGVFHNGLMDGQDNETVAKDFAYTTYWNDTVKHSWDAAREMCSELIKHEG